MTAAAGRCRRRWGHSQILEATYPIGKEELDDLAIKRYVLKSDEAVAASATV